VIKFVGSEEAKPNQKPEKIRRLLKVYFPSTLNTNKVSTKKDTNINKASKMKFQILAHPSDLTKEVLTLRLLDQWLTNKNFKIGNMK